MKKIVFFTARDLSNAGGGERMLFFIANKLCNEYNVEILTPFISIPYYELNKRVKLNTFGLIFHKNAIKRKLQYITILKRLCDWKKNNTYDFFIVSSSMAFLLTSLVSWSRDCRLYAWMHLSYYHPTPKLLKWIEEISYKKFNIISINSMDMEVYQKFSSSVIQIPNPRPFKSIEKASLDKKRIISVGRLEKGKRFDLLVDICTNVFKRIPDWSLDIYGQDDGEKSTIERKISENGMCNRIQIHNPISNIKEEYLKSSIFVTTTRIEAFLLVLIEACECGLPCISFNVPSGIRDIIDNEYNGYLLREGDFDDFEEKLASLMLSDNLRKTMGNNAIEKAKIFDEEAILEKWYKLFG